jgi:CHRD domain-containing protein
MPDMGKARLLIAFALLFVAAQAQDSFKGRLAPVPVDAKTLPDTAGSGTVTATLAGTKLTVSGSFEGLLGAATTAQLHRSPTTGVRGPVIADLTVSKATSGTVSGTVDLTTQQIDDLRKGKLYVQIHSQKAPEGNLWGWILNRGSI